MFRNYRIIDMRCRPPYRDFMYSGYPFGLYDESIAKNFAPFNEGHMPRAFYDRSMDTFMREMDKAGVEMGVAHYRAAWGDPANKRPMPDHMDLVELDGKYPGRFITIAGVSPVYQSLDEIRAIIDKFILEGPLHGIIIEPFADRPGWYMDDKERLYPVLELCREHNLPVMITFGGRGGVREPERHIPALKQCCLDFPEVHFAACHGGFPMAEVMCHLAYLLPNLWLSPDTYLYNSHVSRTYFDAGRSMLRHRLCFGSSYPVIPLDYAVHYCAEKLPKDVLGNFFYNNAASFLNLE